MDNENKTKIERLLELKKLFEQGILTKEEIEAEKSKILGKYTSHQQIEKVQSESSINQDTDSVRILVENENASDSKHKIYIGVGITLLLFVVVGVFFIYRNKSLQNDGVIEEPIESLVTQDGIQKASKSVKNSSPIDTDNDLGNFKNLMSNCSWTKHKNGNFQYPNFFKRYDTFVDDIPANVETYTYSAVELCYWPLLGAWSTEPDFPLSGLQISPTEKVMNVTYKVESKGISSGYTQSGKIYYMKRNIFEGEFVSHSTVLVLINPPEFNEEVVILTKMIAKW